MVLKFGSEERRDKSYFDTPGDVMKILREIMKLEALNRMIDYVTRLGRKGDWPILVIFTPFSVKF
jgi:hypothetical protein